MTHETGLAGYMRPGTGLGQMRDHILKTCNALSGNSLSLLLGGVPVNPRCELWPQTAVSHVSRDRCSPDKHYIGNV